MRSLVLFFALAALPAFAQSADCAAVRRALQLAQSAGVDSGDLWRLERRLCAPQERQVSGETCEQLDAMWMLSIALGEDGDLSQALSAQRQVWCARGEEPRGSLQWANGAVLRSSAGTLYWPSGATARSTSGTWYAPSGTTIRSSSGSVYYANGSQARTSSGRTLLPNGEYADEGRIAMLACQADDAWCRYFLDVARGSNGLRREFAFVGLGRLAAGAR